MLLVLMLTCSLPSYTWFCCKVLPPHMQSTFCCRCCCCHYWYYPVNTRATHRHTIVKTPFTGIRKVIGSIARWFIRRTVSFLKWTKCLAVSKTLLSYGWIEVLHMSGSIEAIEYVEFVRLPASESSQISFVRSYTYEQLMFMFRKAFRKV